MFGSAEVRREPAFAEMTACKSGRHRGSSHPEDHRAPCVAGGTGDRSRICPPSAQAL